MGKYVICGDQHLVESIKEAFENNELKILCSASINSKTEFVVFIVDDLIVDDLTVSKLRIKTHKTVFNDDESLTINFDQTVKTILWEKITLEANKKYLFLMRTKLRAVDGGYERVRLLQQKENVMVIDLSVHFNRAPSANSCDLFCGAGLIREVRFSKEEVELYSRLLATIIEEFFCETKGTFLPYNYSEFSTKMSLFNEMLEHTGFSIGSASFVEKSTKDYLMDMPWKPYYIGMNEEILNQKHDLIFYKDGDKNKGFINDWFCVKYKYRIDSNQQISLINFVNGYHKRSNVTRNLKKKEIENFLRFLHYGIFYLPPPSGNKYNWTEIVQAQSKEDSLTFSVEIMWFVERVLEKGSKIDGLLNYTLYRVVKDTEEGVYQTPFRNVNETHFHNLYSPIIQTLAKQSLIPVLSRRIKEQAVRSAISQVMARNQSHNIGAHVMNKLIGDLNEIDITKFKNYKGCCKNLTKDDKEILKQISFFNNYLKCRMDYLADISMSTPLMQTNKYVYTDLFKDFDKVRLLLENISGLSGAFEFRIEFQKNGNRINDISDDLLVAIPNDILGQQAFYNIIENIIRNTAKHGQGRKTGETVFTINFIDEDSNHSNILKDYIAVEIYDNIEKQSSCQTEEKCECNKEKICGLVKNQNGNIDKDILNDHKLRSTSLGLIEMEASAIYLRKEDVTLVNSADYKIEKDKDSWIRKIKDKETPYFLKAINKNNCLGYRFFLHRPTLALIVTSLKEEKNGHFDKMKKEGIWVISPKVFKDELSAGKVYNHEFVIYDKETVDLQQIISKHKTSLPIRILDMLESEIVEFLKEDTIDEFEEKCWKKWVELRYNCRKIEIVNSHKPAQNEYFKAVFLDHLEDSTAENATNEEVWSKNKEAKYVEALSSLGQSKMPDFYSITNGKEKPLVSYLGGLNFQNVYRQKKNVKTFNKLVESITNKIIVIDERIQELDENSRFKDIPYKELYDKMGVIIPNKSKCDLSSKTFDDAVIREIESFIDDKLKDTKETDFVLLHYSILERMEKEIDDLFYRDDKPKYNANIVITSGRGTPGGLPETVRFVNLSSVISAFVDIRSKYAINYMLNSTRKSKKI